MKDLKYQQRAVAELVEKTVQLLMLGTPRQQLIFKAPTGSGKTVMASKLMPKNGDKALKIRFLGRNIPGLAYDAAADAVVSPVPLADLEGLSKGKKSTLNKFADKMRTMNWRDENGKERRAGQYNIDTEAFLQDFD